MFHDSYATTPCFIGVQYLLIAKLLGKKLPNQFFFRDGGPWSLVFLSLTRGAVPRPVAGLQRTYSRGWAAEDLEPTAGPGIYRYSKLSVSWHVFQTLSLVICPAGPQDLSSKGEACTGNVGGHSLPWPGCLSSVEWAEHAADERRAAQTPTGAKKWL